MLMSHRDLRSLNRNQIGFSYLSSLTSTSLRKSGGSKNPKVTGGHWLVSHRSTRGPSMRAVNVTYLNLQTGAFFLWNSSQLKMKDQDHFA